MKVVTKPNSWIVFGLPLVLFGVVSILMHFTIGTIHFNKLELVLTLDLVITIPFVYYLLIRKTKIPKTSVVPIMAVGLLIGYYFLPSQNQFYLSLFKDWALPFVEFGVLVYIIIKVRTVVKKYKSLKVSSPDFYTTLKETCYDILPRRIAMPFATEIAVFYYGFSQWRTPRTRNKFTYHKKGGTSTILFSFMFLIIIETVVVHMVLQRWSNVAAWILTGLSFYTILQVWGFIKSMWLRPISVDDSYLTLKYGILSEARIPLAHIDRIELTKKAPPKSDLTRDLSPLGDLESHNVLIHLFEEADLVGLYGAKKRFKTIKLFVDTPKLFQCTISDAIANPDNYVVQNNPIKNEEIKTSTLDKEKAVKAIAWIFGISWVFGFMSFNIFSDKESIPFAVSVLLFSMIPALTTIVINKLEGGDWKALNFKRIDIKLAVMAFLTPIVYFFVILSLQYFLNIRSLPDWSKVGSINELLLSLVFGYPIMMFLIMGEEIAWRGYLQEKLIQSFGGLNGLIVLGLIWGIWHLPLSMQGHNFPNNPMIETWITTPLMCIALALVIGYFGMNKKSIFVGIILHASNNHFGGTFLYLTETFSEIQHAITFCILYICMILIFGYLYIKKQPNTSKQIE